MCGGVCGSFLVSITNNAPDPERDSAAVQEFLAKMEADFRAHPLWAGCSEEELDGAGEVSYNILFPFVNFDSIHCRLILKPTKFLL